MWFERLKSTIWQQRIVCKQLIFGKKANKNDWYQLSQLYTDLHTSKEIPHVMLSKYSYTLCS